MEGFMDLIATKWAKEHGGMSNVSYILKSHLLNVSGLTVKSEADQKLRALLREEEMKWALRAKLTNVVQGEDNTQFFHIIANRKHTKKKIIQIEQDQGTIVGHGNLKLYISNYYKQLFGAPKDI